MEWDTNPSTQWPSWNDVEKTRSCDSAGQLLQREPVSATSRTWPVWAGLSFMFVKASYRGHGWGCAYCRGYVLKIEFLNRNQAPGGRRHSSMPMHQTEVSVWLQSGVLDSAILFSPFTFSSWKIWVSNEIMDVEVLGKNKNCFTNVSYYSSPII